MNSTIMRDVHKRRVPSQTFLTDSSHRLELLLELRILSFPACAGRQALAQTPPSGALSALLSRVPLSTLAAVPPQCRNAAPALSDCQNDIQNGGPSLSSMSAQQIASLAEQNGVSQGCCTGIGQLIDSGCACDPAIQSIIDQTGARAGYEGLAMALPKVCGRQPANC